MKTRRYVDRTIVLRTLQHAMVREMGERFDHVAANRILLAVASVPDS